MIAYTKKSDRIAIRKGLWELVNGTDIIPDFHFYTNKEANGLMKSERVYMTEQIKNGGFEKKGIPSLFLGAKIDL